MSGPGPSTAERLQLLAEVLDLARDRQDPDVLTDGHEVLARSRERLDRGPGHVVVALGGGTGSGKSSLSNALAGRQLSAVSPIRPTTDRALVWTVGPPDPELLDWLGVRDRHVVPAREGLPEGLVVLDLPDHDSVRTAHRTAVDAAVKVVDAVAFVVDPMKYAQRSLFEGYLRPLAHHADVVLVILNRIDELDADGRRRCIDDLRRLLGGTGLAGARILATSAVTGEGIDELRGVLAAEVASRRAVTERVHADVARVADLLGRDIDTAPRLSDARTVTDALARAADLSGAVATARAAYAERALATTRPPLTALLTRGSRRVIRPFRVPAAIRLRAGGRLGGAATPVSSGGEEAAAAASTQPRASVRPSTDVALRHAVRALVDPVAGGFPRVWAVRLRELAEDVARRLPPRTRDALDVVALHTPRRLWWAVVAFCWTLVELAVVVGIGWLLGLLLIGWLRLPDPPTPMLGEVPWPTVLVLAGIPLWLLFQGLRTFAVRRGADRHARRAARRLRSQIEAAAHVGLRPITEEVAIRDRLVAALARLGGVRAP